MMAARPPRRHGRVFLDSSCFLALANQNDARHDEARRIWTRLTEQRRATFTTNFVIAETHALLLGRLGRPPAIAFLRTVDRGSTTIQRVTEDDERLARSIIFRYDDREFSLTDATSFSVMERLATDVAFTFDRHFVQYGLTVLSA